MTKVGIAVVVVTAGMLLMPCLADQANAPGDRKPKATTASEPSPRPPSVRAPKSSAQAAASGTAISEILGQNLTVDAGKSVRIFAKSDFTGAERASFGMYADPAVNIVKTRVAVWWAVANAPTYSVQDVIAGSNYPYTNVGGGNVPVYGSTLFVDVINDSDSAITIQQLTVYAVAH